MCGPFVKTPSEINPAARCMDLRATVLPVCSYAPLRTKKTWSGTLSDLPISSLNIPGTCVILAISSDSSLVSYSIGLVNRSLSGARGILSGPGGTSDGPRGLPFVVPGVDLPQMYWLKSHGRHPVQDERAVPRIWKKGRPANPLSRSSHPRPHDSVSIARNVWSLRWPQSGRKS